MSYAVTGATGALGRLVVTALLERGVAPGDVVALVRTPARAADLAALGVQVRPFDYDAPATLAPALAGVQRLLLISGNAVGQRVAQHTAVIEAARAAGVGHLFYTSILAADTTANPLAPEHLATEQALAASGLPFTLLRNGWYTENYTARVAEFLATGSIPHSAGPAALSLATGAPLFPVSVHYEPAARARSPWRSWTAVAVVHPRVDVPAALAPAPGERPDRRAQTAALAQACVDVLSDAVREHPADWHMLQRAFTGEVSR